LVGNTVRLAVELADGTGGVADGQRVGPEIGGLGVRQISALLVAPTRFDPLRCHW